MFSYRNYVALTVCMPQIPLCDKKFITRDRFFLPVLKCFPHLFWTSWKKPVYGLLERLPRWPPHSQTWKFWLDTSSKNLYFTAKQRTTAMPKLIRDPVSIYTSKMLRFKAILSQNFNIWIRHQKFFFCSLKQLG